MRKIIIVLFLTFIFGCSNLGDYNYQLQKNIELKVKLENISYHSENGYNWSSLNFEYNILNNSHKQIYFRFDSIKIQFNGELSSKIYYNSIASVIPKREKLHEGENRYSLYAVFPDSIQSIQQNKLKILSDGLIQ